MLYQIIDLGFCRGHILRQQFINRHPLGKMILYHFDPSIVTENHSMSMQRRVKGL
jgi:hypothetical protein